MTLVRPSCWYWIPPFAPLKVPREVARGGATWLAARRLAPGALPDTVPDPELLAVELAPVAWLSSSTPPPTRTTAAPTPARTRRAGGDRMTGRRCLRRVP